MPDSYPLLLKIGNSIILKSMTISNTGDNSKFTLFSSYHKPFPIPEVSYVRPIHAGKTTSLLNLGLEGDDAGDNISHQNLYWSELTVAYYVWKNYKKEEIPFWGLCHYRRYFISRFYWGNLKKEYSLSPANKAFEQIFTPALVTLVNNELRSGKVILPIPYRFIKLKKWSVKKQYIKDHDAASWQATENAMAKLYPEFLSSTKSVMDGLTCSWYNMMIASWDFWDGYLTWLFAILFEVQSELESRPEPVPLRIYGNLSERLLNIYVHHKKKSGQEVKYLPIANIK